TGSTLVLAGWSVSSASARPAAIPAASKTARFFKASPPCDCACPPHTRFIARGTAWESAGRCSPWTTATRGSSRDPGRSSDSWALACRLPVTAHSGMEDTPALTYRCGGSAGFAQRNFSGRAHLLPDYPVRQDGVQAPGPKQHSGDCGCTQPRSPSARPSLAQG